MAVIAHLPEGWTATRTTMQRLARVMTAFPREAAPPDPHWTHVAMAPEPEGFAAVGTPLADRTTLASRLDLATHRIVVSAGAEESAISLIDGGTAPRIVGATLMALASPHGPAVPVDRDVFADAVPGAYDPDHAGAFLTASSVVVSAMERIATDPSGTVLGPHLWSHGFDIATEWISPRSVTVDGRTAPAQIATGWYPDDASYVYVNPWPFSDDFTGVRLPHGAVWNTHGWQGAKLDVPVEGLPSQALIDLADAVHLACAEVLGA